MTRNRHSPHIARTAPRRRVMQRVILESAIVRRI